MTVCWFVARGGGTGSRLALVGNDTKRPNIIHHCLTMSGLILYKLRRANLFYYYLFVNPSSYLTWALVMTLWRLGSRNRLSSGKWGPLSMSHHPYPSIRHRLLLLLARQSDRLESTDVKQCTVSVNNQLIQVKRGVTTQWFAVHRVRCYFGV